METKVIISIEEFDLLIRKIISEELIKHDRGKAPEYVSRKEAAKLLNISLPTLYKYCKLNQITIYEIASKHKIKLDDLENLKLVKTYNKKQKENGN